MLKVVQNNQTLAHFRAETPMNQHYIFGQNGTASEITVEFASDSSLFGIHQTPTATFTIFPLPGNKCYIVKLQHHFFRF